MTIFKKKNPTVALYYLLDEALSEAKRKNCKKFYFSLLDNEKEKAKKWCNKNNVYMEVDHKTDNNIIYKFIILNKE